MRPSNSLTYEPGVERGVPWGRDLFTFVTSAAGHMMRTLQRPRKSRPSKRQVNHRRFLHNMIHKKFAEIEAANRQLASALFSKDGQDGQPLSPHPVLTSDQSEETHNEEPSTIMTLPSFSFVPTPLGLSLLPSDGAGPQHPEEEPGSLWSFNLQLESPGKQGAHSHTFSPDKQCTEANGLPSRRERVTTNDYTLNSTNNTDHQVNPQHEPIKCHDELRSSNTEFEANVRGWVGDAQKCGRIQDAPNSDFIQPSNARTLCIDTAAFNPMPSSEPHPRASCAFGIHIFADGESAQTNMHCVVENPQTDVLGNYDLVIEDESDGIYSQPLSITVWGAQKDDDTDSESHFTGAFLNGSSSYVDKTTDRWEAGARSTENQHKLTSTVHPKRVYDTNLSQSSNSSLDRVISCPEPCNISLHCHTKSSSEPNLERTNNMNSQSNIGFTRKSNIDHNMGMNTRTVSFSNTNSPDYFATSLPSFVTLDTVRMNEVRETVHADEALGSREFCSGYPMRNNKIKTPTLNSRSAEVEMHRGVKLPSHEDNNQFYKSNGSGYERTGTDFAQIFPDLGYSTQGASECVLRPIMDISLNEPPCLVGDNFEAPNPKAQNACAHSTLSCTKSWVFQTHNPFEGVARSFPAPVSKPHFNQILTPPLEEDWLFADIVEESQTRGIA